MQGFEQTFTALAAMCGSGFVGFLPLTLAGLIGLRCTYGRFRRR
jgi:hypothetical protein